MHEHIVDSLQGLAVDMTTLTPDPANARFHDQRNVDIVQRSLEKFKQRIPIVVQKEGMVVRAGNARFEAATRLGWSHIAAVVVDESNVQAAAFAIADNRTAELAEWDFKQLSANIEAIDFDFLEMTPEELGFNQDEIENMHFGTAWDDKNLDESHYEGTRDNIDGSSLVLKFTQDQAESLRLMLKLPTEALSTELVLVSIAALGR